MEQRFVVLNDWTDFCRSQPPLEWLREWGEVTIHTAPAANDDDVEPAPDGDMSGVVNPAALERRGAWATKV